jgi:hypothetical protein
VGPAPVASALNASGPMLVVTTPADVGRMPPGTADQAIMQAGLDDGRPDDIALLPAARRDPFC